MDSMCLVIRNVFDPDCPEQKDSFLIYINGELTFKKINK